MADNELPDDSDFPPLNDDTIGSLFVDRWGVVWACDLFEDVDGRFLGWTPIGRTDDQE